MAVKALGAKVIKISLSRAAKDISAQLVWVRELLIFLSIVLFILFYMLMHMARHPRGVLIEEPVSKAQWIFDDDVYKELLSKLHRHVILLLFLILNPKPP